MTGDQPSRTAEYMALFRAVETAEPADRRLFDDPYAAAQDADALVILNEWQEFAELDLKRLHYTLRYPIVIDGRNLYKPQEMQSHGFTYVSVGRQAAYHAQEGKPRKA